MNEGRVYLTPEDKEAMVRDLARLVRIDSVRTAPKPGMPFGEGGAKALAQALSLLSEHGYTAKNYDNYALEADFGPAPTLMLLAHLDVVPAGDGWTREPFALTREGERIYGRGVTDDKGPAVACIYAMDLCRRTYGEPKTGVRLVLGSGEETGSEDMDRYFSLRPTLPYTLSPDAEYPLINIEKGRYAPVFTKAAPTGGKRRLVSFAGGQTQNIVPGKASAELAGVSEEEALAAAERTSAITGVAFTVRASDNGVTVLAEGASAHASLPHLGNNAQTGLLALINALSLDKSEAADTVAALCGLFPHGQTDGENVGVKRSDGVSGALTLNFGVFSYKDGVFACGADMRCPVCADGMDIPGIFSKAVGAAGFTAEGALNPSHCVPESSPLVRTCLQVYEDRTGQKGECIAIGGGTYVHGIDGGVAFGVEFPGRDYRIHGADETAEIDELALTAEIYADVIRALCY